MSEHSERQLTEIGARLRGLSGEQRKTLFRLLRQKGVDVARLPIQPVLAGEPLPLSYAQQRQWVLWQLDPDGAAYHIPSALRLRGHLDVAALQQSVTALIARHAVFRTRFVQTQGDPVQVVDPARPFELAVEEVSAEVDGHRLKDVVEAEFQRPFDLHQGPLLRVRLLRLAADDHLLLLTLHHIVSDGWSSALLVEELLHGYRRAHQGLASELDALPIQYADYAAWQRQWMDAGEGERQLAYWKEYLGEEQPVLRLPMTGTRRAAAVTPAGRIDIPLDADLSQRLRRFAQEQGLTPFMLLLASFQALLHRYSGQADVRIGVPVANRNRAETQGLIGFFVNTQVTKALFAPGTRFSDLLASTREAALDAQANQDIPFERLVEALQPERSLDHHPLFQVLFNHQNDAPSKRTVADLDGLLIEPFDVGEQQAQFDLTLSTQDDGQRFRAALIYAGDRFETPLMERMAEHWRNLLRAAIQAPTTPICALPMLADAERRQILEDWNATACDFPDPVFVHRLFERQAAATPHACALRFAGNRLEYAELNLRANRLAHRLIHHGVGPDTLVGIAMQRSVEMVVGLLAILKAGGAYVPLDPDYPAERLAYMLEDSGVRLLLSQAEVLESLPLPSGVHALCLDSDRDGLEPSFADVANPKPALSAEHLAYVIYTSGSTGRPKGAGNHHAALYNRLAWMQQAYGLAPEDRVLQKTPFSFDVSVWEFFWPLMTGACLVIAAPGEHRDPASLIATIRREQVTTLHFVPSMLSAFLHEPGADRCEGLKRILCSGEALPLETQALALSRLPQAQLYNLYGPTEAAIDVTHWHCREEGRDSVPIGRPIANLRTHILDAALEPVPIGCSGELYLGGIGLARGYHRRPGLTAERFVADPFRPGERLYRTGDLARYREDGVIEYLGRLDHQVKIRGLRIELGEIEARLREHSALREAAVLAITLGSSSQLAAYLVPHDSRCAAQDLIDTLRTYLAESLPEHMVPTQWQILERMPLSPNGKLDRKALPLPQASPGRQAGLEPQTPMERDLAGLWKEVLGLERVNADDNFFSLGGDSIISIQVVSRARQLGIRLAPRDLFQHQTIQALARVARRAEHVEIEQGAVDGPSLLTPIQHAFFANDIPQRQHWNQALLLQPRQAIEPEALERALRTLLAHHDALRLRFSPAADGWTAWHAPLEQAAEGLLWQRTAADSDELERLCDAAQRSLELEHGPLLRALLVELADGQQRLLLVFHHLVVDGVSWRILLEDLQSAYQAAAQDAPARLPAKTTAFRGWASQLQTFARDEARQREVLHWENLLGEAAAGLPVDRAEGRALRGLAHTLYSRLDADQTRRLLQDAPAAYRTQVNDLLLTALARTICRWTGDAQVLVQLEGHGREELFPSTDLTRTLGWLTALYPVRLDADPDPGTSIKRIKEQLRDLPDKGLGYGALRYLGDAATRARMNALPVPRITFNYLGQFDRSFSDDALFLPARESSGACHHPDAPLDNWLSINGEVYAGELVLGWSFSREMFDDATIQRLADDYSAELQALVEHCLQRPQAALTPSDVGLSGLDQTRLDTLPPFDAPIEDIYPLSPMQQGMLFHSLEDDREGLYINQTSVTVEGLDVERFSQAWQRTTQRHGILRSAFLSRNDWPEPLQVVLRQVEVPLEVLDWRDRANPEAALTELAEADCAKGFSLDRAPLQRVTLVRLDERRWQLIWTSHHILMDGWSRSRLLGEVLHLYAGHTPPPMPSDYRDYIAWLRGQPADALERFWKDQLQALPGTTQLAPCVHPQPQGGLDGHEALYLDWDAARTARLLDNARRQRVTPNTLIQAAWLLLLQRYTGQSTVCFGATVAGRPASLEGAEDMLGLFINTLPIIQTPRADMKVADWLQALQTLNLHVRDHEHAALADIQRWSGQGGQPLFDSILVFENYPLDQRLRESADNGLRFGESQNRDVTNFAMDLAIHLDDRLSIEFLYLRNRFSAEGCAQILRSFEHLLEQILARPQDSLGRLEMLAAAEVERLEDENRLEPRNEDPRLLAELIGAHAGRDPHAPVLICGSRQLDREALEDQANRLAHYLIAQGVGPEDRIGVALERSVELVVALYAVHKAGAAYVPLDIDYPAERLHWIMRDSRMRLLLTRSDLEARLPQVEGLPRAELDRLSLADYGAQCPAPRAAPENLAYLIYTSGSTGQPKGVAVAQGPLRMHCEAIVRLYEMNERTRELHFMSFAFDGAHERWLSTLLAGGCLVIRDDGLWTPEQTWQALHRHAISIACFPPAYLQQLADYAESQGNPPPVDIYCFGGDAVADATFEQVTRTLRPRCLTNGYGPTETVVTPMLWKVEAGQHCEAAYAPIGRRVGQRRLYVLDADLNLLPDGVAGELYIGGEGLARGYHDRPGLSAERFVADPFAKGARMYRTGDLVRRRADGVIDYLGRLDHQVKIRGFRIELGEIEARLRAFADVREALVLARESEGDKRLVGYVVAGDDEGLGNRLRERLQAELPDYMVPVQILVLPAFPIGPNGKLDRRALPMPSFHSREFVAPRNELERQLAVIWQDVLGVERIGVTDNFFELGGDSLRTLKVISRVRARPELGLELKLREMMAKPTIAELSGYRPQDDENPAGLDPLLPLNRPIEGVAPVFCLHAGFGTVFDYEPLARRLEGLRGVYGLQCRMLLDRAWRDDRLETMAIDYAQYIRQKQPRGPYHLLGWSLGGTLAILVAAELEKQGQEVAFVGLVDSFLPSPAGDSEPDDWPAELQQFLRVVLMQDDLRLDASALGDEPEAAEVEALIARVLGDLGSPGETGQAMLGAEELTHTFLVACRLKTLSRGLGELPRIRRTPDCWWAQADTDPIRRGFEQRFLAGHSGEVIEASHFDILGQPRLLQQLQARIAPADLTLA
ncbi:non-ribosomal peptide synthetase [Pseudomonas sp. RIT-PI-AD]|uniref:non-ribosomal peptide synthetase n=1 Tax=Pseudomonas sp. RIT-PI-AD TaxID=3035294 RepID=UPI0021DB6764|nr:non-ribosomal peptide synthetase [Pseudomonas sp. RIT-PI-AD]